MTKVLHIDASPRAERSRSRDIASHFLDRLSQDRPGIAVERYDLWAMDLPELGGGMIEGRYGMIMGGDVAPEMLAAWQAIERHVEAFLAHDVFVISTPMWNFGIPYRLKHFIDVVTQPRMAFTNDAQGNVTGHAAGKRAVLIGASAMDIRPGSELAMFDFQIAYLEAWMRFIGVEDIAVLRAAPTFGPEEAVEAAMAKARGEAEAMARDWAS